MPVLKMYIGAMFIDQSPLDYTGLLTLKDREHHQKRVMAELFDNHFEKVQLADREPHFFIDGVQSKVNTAI